MQLGHKPRYLAEWTCTITCGFLLFCDTLISYFYRRAGLNIITLLQIWGQPTIMK